MNSKRLVEILNDLLPRIPEDGWLPCYKIPGVYTGDERKEVAGELVALGCLQRGWEPCGKDGIGGTFFKEGVREVLEQLK